jgi:hypothetical protein
LFLTHFFVATLHALPTGLATIVHVLLVLKALPALVHALTALIHAFPALVHALTTFVHALFVAPSAVVDTLFVAPPTVVDTFFVRDTPILFASPLLRLASRLSTFLVSPILPSRFLAIFSAASESTQFSTQLRRRGLVRRAWAWAHDWLGDLRQLLWA